MSTATIRPLSWRLSPELTTLTPSFFALKLPPHWKLSLSELHNANREKGDKRTLPCDGLHRALTALVGDLLVVEPRAWFGKNAAEFWLISDREVALEAIHLIVLTWAQVMWEKSPQCAATLASLKAEDLQWQIIAPNLADWNCSDNGTANPRSPSAFRLLPHYIAGELSRTGVMLHFGNSSPNLRRCPTDNGAELMTWPPEKLTVGAAQTPVFWCLALAFTVQTVPFQGYPLLNCEIKVRRWKKPNARFPKGEFGAYLHTAVPWIDSLERTNSFQKASLCWQRTADGFEAVWSDHSHLVEIVNRLSPHRRFPTAQEVFDADFPANAGASPFASIVHSTKMKSHPVGAGLFPVDLREVCQQLTAHLAPLQLQLAPQPNRIQIPVNAAGDGTPKHLFARAVSAKNAVKAEQIQTHRSENVPLNDSSHVHLELFYQSEPVRAAFEGTLREFFGVAPHQQFPVALENGGLLHFRAEPLGAIGAQLEARRSRVAYLQRCEEVAQFFRARGPQLPLEPTLSFVELANADQFKNVGDPKNALRAGFAACGRLTQFLNTPKEELPAGKSWENAKGALLDAMRQLGLKGQFPRWHKTNLPDDLKIMGLWMVKNCLDSTRQKCGTLPLWLRIDTASGRIEAKARGFTDWLPYYQAQLALAHPTHITMQPTSNDAEIMAWIEDNLRSQISGNTLLVCDAQNSRNTWNWLTNGNITPDALHFLRGARAEPLQSWPNWSGLRAVRVRDSAAGELPQHFVPTDDGATWTQGAYAFEDARLAKEAKTRVYGSVAGKPAQFKTSNTASRWGANIADNAFNPRLLELTAAVLQPNDDPELWAAFVHRLRDASAHYGAETALPFPLHLAMKIGEYVLPV